MSRQVNWIFLQLLCGTVLMIASCSVDKKINASVSTDGAESESSFTIEEISGKSASYSAGMLVDVDVRFSIDVNAKVFESTSVTLTGSRCAAFLAVLDRGDTVRYRYVVKKTDNEEFLNVTAYNSDSSCAKRVPESDNRFALPAQKNLGSTSKISLDTVAPSIESITSTRAAYKPGDTISIWVNFSEAVTSQTKSLSLTLTGSRVATLRSQPSDRVLEYSYNVQPLDDAADITVTAFSSGTELIKDLAGNAAILTLPEGNVAKLKFDNKAPQIVSISGPSGTYRLGDLIDIDVKYSEKVSYTNPSWGGRLYFTSPASSKLAATYQSKVDDFTLRFRYEVIASVAIERLNVALIQASIVDDSFNYASTALPSGANLAETSNIILDGSPVEVGAIESSNSSAINPRMTFYDSIGKKHWTVFLDSGVLRIWNSSDALHWRASPSISLNSSRIGLAHRILEGKTFVFVAAEENNYDITLRRGVITNDQIEFETSKLVFDGTSSSDAYSRPLVACNITHLWVSASHQTADGSNLVVKRTKEVKVGTNIQWDPTMIPGVPTFTPAEANLYAGNDGKMFLLAKVDKALYAYYYDGNDWIVTGNTSIRRGESNWQQTIPFGYKASDTLNGPVSSIAAYGKKVYFAGSFSNAGDNPKATKIAAWTGVQWESLGDPKLDGSVNVIAANESGIYIGGTFTSVAGVPNTRGIARWNGSGWEALGSGVVGSVNSIGISGSSVYVGGAFSQAGNQPNTQNLAIWNGSSWSPVGKGLNNLVYSLAALDNKIYIGGAFTDAGDLPDGDGIVAWNGNSFEALGSGSQNGTIYSIAAGKGKVYVGGYFNDMGGNIYADSIAVWDGKSWQSVDYGLGGPAVVNFVYLDGSTLHVGGDFEFRDQSLQMPGYDRRFYQAPRRHWASWEENRVWNSDGTGRWLGGSDKLKAAVNAGHSYYFAYAERLIEGRKVATRDAESYSAVVTKGGALKVVTTNNGCPYYLELAQSQWSWAKMVFSSCSYLSSNNKDFNISYDPKTEFSYVFWRENNLLRYRSLASGWGGCATPMDFNLNNMVSIGTCDDVIPEDGRLKCILFDSIVPRRIKSIFVKPDKDICGW